jgi:hypothetical protein
MPAPVLHRTSSPLTISADYNDFATGEGIKSYSLCSVKDSVGTNFILTDKPIYSSQIIYSEAIGQSALTKEIDVTFDKEFNVTRIIDGDVVVNLGMAIGLVGSTFDHSAYFKVKVQEWDGTTATDLSSYVQTPTISADTTDQHYSQMLVFKIPVVNGKVRAGNFLRLLVEGWTTTSGGGGDGWIQIGVDPLSREPGAVENGDTVPYSGLWAQNDVTKSTIYFPFKATI